MPVLISDVCDRLHHWSFFSASLCCTCKQAHICTVQMYFFNKQDTVCLISSYLSRCPPIDSSVVPRHWTLSLACKVKLATNYIPCVRGWLHTHNCAAVLDLNMYPSWTRLIYNDTDHPFHKRTQTVIQQNNIGNKFVPRHIIPGHPRIQTAQIFESIGSSWSGPAKFDARANNHKNLYETNEGTLNVNLKKPHSIPTSNKFASIR